MLKPREFKNELDTYAMSALLTQNHTNFGDRFYTYNPKVVAFKEFRFQASLTQPNIAI